MKTLIKILCTFILLFSSNSVFAHLEDYGTRTYRQPNGFAFQGRHFCDEFGEYYQTTDGYLFTYNQGDKYFHYVVLDTLGNLEASWAKVGIDDPQKFRIHPDAFKTIHLLQEIARGRNEAKLSGQLGTLSQSLVSSVPSSIYLQVILVEFSDIKHQNPTDWPMPLGYGGTKTSYPEYTTLQFTNFLFSTNTYNTTSPDGEAVYGSMRDYFSDMSQGSFSLTGTVLNQNQPGGSIPRWVVLSNTKMHYQNGGFSDFVNDVLTAAQTQQGIVPTLDATHRLCIIYAGNMYVSGGLHPQTTINGPYYINSERFKYPPDGIPRNSEVNKLILIK